jgi:cardiolipin synthase
MNDWLGLALSSGALVLLASFAVHASVVVSVLLTEGRKPTATLAWVLTITFLPVIGILLYLAIGTTRSARALTERTDLRPRLRARLESLASDAATRVHEDALDARTQAMVHLGSRLATAPASSGNRVAMLVDADATYRAMTEAIDAARDHVHVEFYIIQPDAVGEGLRDRLTQRARDGVEVRVLVDAVGSAALPRSFWDPLVEAGGHAATFSPVRFRFRRRDRVDFRNHRKLVIVDGRVGFTGGINIGREYLGLDPEHGDWRDTHMRIEGPAVSGLQLAFAEDWFVASGELPDADRFYPPFPVAGDSPDCLVQVIDSGPDRSFSPMEHFHLQAIGLARERVWLTTPYFVPSDSILKALITAALRGVDVRCLLPGRSDNLLVTAAGRSYYSVLLQAGVRIFEYQRGFAHAKSMLVDTWMGTVGSANMDLRSFLLNFELNAFVYDATFVQAMADQFRIDLGHAAEVDEARIAARGFGTRVVQSAARLASPLL